ncbi:MAG: 50S ribosomal protein L13 [Patescibacteria group bacterium]
MSIPNKPIELDATDKILGRLASEIAVLLMGKDRSDYAPNIIQCPNVIVNNCDKIKITGNKAEQKKYYKHSGYPGGIKEKKYSEMNSTLVLKNAVSGMLPKNKLQNVLLKKLTLNN